MKTTPRNALIVLEIFNYDAFDIGDILLSLPEETKVIGWGSLGVFISNPSFKITNDTVNCPRVYVIENEEGELIVDCSSVMEVSPQQEQKKSNLYESALELIQNIKDNQGLELAVIESTPIQYPLNDFGKVNLLKESGGIVKRIGYKGTGNDIFQMTADEVLAPYQSEIEKIYTEIIKNQVIMGSPMIPITQESDDMLQFSYPNINTINSSLSKAMEKECLHSWKSYEGFTNRYHYCEKCDLKKD